MRKFATPVAACCGILVVFGIAGAASLTTSGASDGAADRAAVAALDTRFQAAVKHNDAHAMAQILHNEMVLVLGNGQVLSREQQLQRARDQTIVYEIQDEEEGTQTVRVSGDTAVVTARLWIRGRRSGSNFERRLWFSDTYVRTKSGWKYLFGQASLPLPLPETVTPSIDLNPQ